MVFKDAQPGTQFFHWTVGAEVFQTGGRVGQGGRLHGGCAPFDRMGFPANAITVSYRDGVADNLKLPVHMIDQLTGHDFHGAGIAELFHRRDDIHDGGVIAFRRIFLIWERADAIRTAFQTNPVVRGLDQLVPVNRFDQVAVHARIQTLFLIPFIALAVRAMMGVRRPRPCPASRVRISAVASNPFKTGIWMSMRIKS